MRQRFILPVRNAVLQAFAWLHAAGVRGEARRTTLALYYRLSTWSLLSKLPTVLFFRSAVAVNPGTLFFCTLISAPRSVLLRRAACYRALLYGTSALYLRLCVDWRIRCWAVSFSRLYLRTFLLSAFTFFTSGFALPLLHSVQLATSGVLVGEWSLAAPPFYILPACVLRSRRL